MTHFYITVGEDGSTQQIYKDGQAYGEAVKLEQLYSIVTIYFRLGAANLELMVNQPDSEQRRSYGLQSFLMSLTGLEAFTNTFFHLRANELASDALLARIKQKHGSLSNKLKELIELTPNGPLINQEALLQRIFELSQLRNDIVHPRWVPASMTLGSEVSVTINGLVQNYQAVFEDQQFCREVLMWCLLVLARVAQAHGHDDVTGFMFHWTGFYGLTLPAILGELGLTADESRQ